MGGKSKPSYFINTKTGQITREEMRGFYQLLKGRKANKPE